MKVVWGCAASGNVTWKLESRMKASYPEFFSSGDFLGQKFIKYRRVVKP